MASHLSRTALASCRTVVTKRSLHTSVRRSAISQFTMPAMSPTMTEGGIASWKKQEGEAFTTGDILLEIETDKATMDVEAQDDGIMGKIIAPDGSKGVPVGKVIALLAEEGDDISNLEVPKEESSSSKDTSATPPKPKDEPAPAPKAETPPQQSATTPSSSHTFHPKSSRPIFPSVLRLLQENNLSEDVDKIGIKGTGVRGMLTKGDVLAYLGKAQGPNGTYKVAEKKAEVAPAKKDEPPKSFTADDVRRLIVAGMERRVKPVQATTLEPTFDSVLGDYIKYSPTPAATTPVIPPPAKAPSASYFDGLF